MQQKLIDFTNLLRKSGVRVSVAETLDAFVALDEVSIGDREVFKDALRTTMVKRGEDIAGLRAPLRPLLVGLLRRPARRLRQGRAGPARERARSTSRS